MNNENDRMSREAFNALVDNVERQAEANVKSGQLIAEHSNPALKRLAVHDPDLARLLTQGIVERGKQSQLVLDHIRARREGKRCAKPPL